MRVYELASQLGVSSRDVLLLLEELGVGGKTASSTVPPNHLPGMRVRLSGGAAPAAKPVTPPREKPAPAITSTTEEAPSARPPTPERAPEEGEQAEGNIRLRAPVTVANFATALDTEAGIIVQAAADLGEELTEDGYISTELVMLIGEQWGYAIEVEEPELEVIELEPEPEPEREPERPDLVIERPRGETELKRVPLPPRKTGKVEAPVLRVVPRRIASSDAPPRPPVVTVLGHVDHGKTTLLDAIREANVAAGEPGAITQHIGAYQVDVKGQPITFIDTPGHEAFTAMRARGAQVTDIAILIVAADDGVMPQTFEAVDHAQAAGVPIIVAINKIDRPSASPENIKQRLSEKGLVPEEWGGDTIYLLISALEKTGISELLDMIVLVAEMRDLRAEKNNPAGGVVLEAEMDKRRGPVATFLVQEGTLRTGDAIVVGSVAGKVRAMTDDRGHRLKEAGPSTPVQIMGLSEVPAASETFQVVKTDREARTLAQGTQATLREDQFRAVEPSTMADLSQLFATGAGKTLHLILKADTQGTVEAIQKALSQIESEEVNLKLLHAGVGDITESDSSLAAATRPTVLLGFQVGADAPARRMAADEHIEIRLYQVIYDLIDDVRDTLLGMLEAKFEEVVAGEAEVRALFASSRIGTIAGCYVVNGVMMRGATGRVRRRGKVVWEGRIASLRRLQDDVTEVSQGYECGIVLTGFNDVQVGDTIECVEQRELRRSVL